MQRLAPNGQRWAEYCGPAPPAVDGDDRLTGAWGECINSGVIFEITNPGWDENPAFEGGPVGQAIEYCAACGYEDFCGILEGAEEVMKQEMEGAEGDQFAFLRHRCKNGLMWKEYCERMPPTFDNQGYVNGAWGECLTAAVIFEHQNPDWSKLPLYMEDGPAGQVIMFFDQCGHGDNVGSMDKTETATHEAIEQGVKIPVFDEVYQALVGEHEAEHVNEDPPEMTGRKKALLIGVNYPGQKAELRGCINDVHTWKELLMNQYEFSERDMLILTDDQDDPNRQPTLANMRAGLRWLAAGAKPGDVLFWQYSGHGGQQRSKSQNEADGMDEVLCPTDYASAGCLVDDEIFDTVVTPLESGVKLTIILDCCHSGTAVDLPVTWTGDGWEEVGGTSYTAGDVQMFSGCEDDQCSMDAQHAGNFGGAMTTAMTQAIQEDPGSTYPNLLNRLHEILKERNFEQYPRLTSSQKFDPTSKSFHLCEGAIPNQNSVLGSTGPPRLHASRPNAGGDEECVIM